MFEGLLQPAHLMVVIVMLVIVGIPAFVVLRLLWKAGFRFGRPPDQKG